MAVILILLALVGCGAVAFALLYKQVEAGQDVAVDIERKKVQALSMVEGFEPAIVYAGLRGSYGLAIDPISEQFAIAIPGHDARLYHFSQLVAVEVEKDGDTITTTKGRVDASGAAVATALIGPLGMALGAKTSSTSISKVVVTKLALKLYVNDLYTPCFEIPFTTPWMGPVDVANAAANLDRWYGRVRTILVGIERSGGSIDLTKAVAHAQPAPTPGHPNTGTSWAGRVFGA